MLALILCAVALLLCAAARPVSGWDALLIIALLLAIPWLAAESSTPARVVVALVCVGTLVPKTVDASIAPDHWLGRSTGEWIAYLCNSLILVDRNRPPQTTRSQIGPIIRGVCEVTAGILLLIWAMGAGLGRVSFWLDHGVKLLAAYLCVFDGGFYLLCAILRAAGARVIDFSRDSILARTPADFWRRYNREAGRFLYEDVFKPLGGLRHPRRAILIVMLANGVLHEYLAWVIIGKIQGYQMAFFMLQGIAAALTFRLRPRGVIGVSVGIILTLAFMFFTSVLFFASVNQIMPWYDCGLGRFLP